MSNSCNPWTAACQASLSITNSQSLLKLMCNESVMPSNDGDAISSSVVPFSSCLQSFPASRSYLRSQFFASGSESTGASASASVLPMNIQGWFPFEWTGWISLQPKALSGVFSKSINSLALSLLHSPTLTSIHDHWKNHSLEVLLGGFIKYIILQYRETYLSNLSSIPLTFPKVFDTVFTLQDLRIHQLVLLVMLGGR